MAEEAVDGRRDAREVFVHQPRRLVDPLVAHEQEEREAEAGDDDEVDARPLGDVDEEDAEDDDHQVAHKAEAAREVKLRGRGGGDRAPLKGVKGINKSGAGSGEGGTVSPVTMVSDGDSIPTSPCNTAGAAAGAKRETPPSLYGWNRGRGTTWEIGEVAGKDK